MDAGEAIAREQIRAVIHRYNHAGDRGDLETLSRCFAPDGVLELPERVELVGREAIRRHLAGVVADVAERSERALVRHHVSSVHIELGGAGAASASSYFLVFTEIGLDHWGGYRDRFVRSEDEWWIARRRVRVDGAALGSRMAAPHA